MMVLMHLMTPVAVVLVLVVEVAVVVAVAVAVVVVEAVAVVVNSLSPQDAAGRPNCNHLDFLSCLQLCTGYEHQLKRQGSPPLPPAVDPRSPREDE